MDMIFYKLQDEVNDVKKTRTLTATATYTPLTVQGTLRGATSKVAPIIEFSKPITYFNDYNYCYIADFKRYYFVTDMVSIRVGFTEIDLKVDVLTSFLTQNNIGNLEGFVGRCSNSTYYSNEIPDNRVQFKSIHDVTVVTPTNISINDGNCVNTTFSFNNSNNISISVSATKFVYQYPTLDDITVPVPLRTLVGVNTISGEQFMPRGNTYIYVCDITQTISWDSYTYPKMVDLLFNALEKDDAQSFINSIVVFPFTIPHNTTAVPVYLDGDKISEGSTDLVMFPSKGFNSGFLVIKDFILTLPSTYNNDFTKYEPYNKCEIYLPFLGWVDISLKDNLNCRLIVYYNVEYSTGRGNVYVYNKTKENLVYQSNVLLGIQVPVNTTNMKENELKDQNYTRNYIAGILTSTATGIIGGATLNPYLFVAGTTGVVTTSIQYMNNENLLIDKASNKTYANDAVSGFISGLDVKLKYTHLYIENYSNTTEETEYINHVGKPTNKILQLSSIPVSASYHTYAEIVDLHTTSESGLYSIEDITSKEVEELKTLCSQGIYL